MGNRPLRNRRLVLAALLIALGTALAAFVRVPVGVATATPVQHAINVLAAVWLGPGGAVTVAFLISLLRNLLGTGTPLAFPGSLFGAALAGFFYRSTRRPEAAVAGEILGTGVIGALAAFPLARWLLGHEAAAWFFYVVPFAASSTVGALGAWFVLRLLPGPVPGPEPGAGAGAPPEATTRPPRGGHG